MKHELIKAAGKNGIFVHLTGFETYDYLKIKLPLIQLGKELWEEGIACLPATDMTDYFLNEYNTFIFHGVPSANFASIVSKFDGKKLIWFVDDDMYSIPEWNPVRKTMDYTGIQIFNMVLERADIICATTEPLRQAMGHPEKTIVLPNLLDMSRVPHYKPREYFNRFGWCGGNTHFQDVRLLEQTVLDHPEKEFIFYGMLPERLTEYYRIPGQTALQIKPNRNNIGFVEITDYTTYQAYLINLGLDCGLAPLVDCKFNHSKSVLKWMEYSSLGIPTIASCVPPYSDVIKNGITGLLVEHNAWDEALDAVNNDIGHNAYEEVKNNWSWQSEKRNVWKAAYHKFVEEL